VTAAAVEAERGRAEGVDARWRFFDLARRTAKWIVAVLVVSLVLPAVTKQWSDNQQQRQLKSDVTAGLAAAVAKATTEGGFLIGQRESAAVRAKYQDTLAAWKSEASAIEAQLIAYFATTKDPNDDALVNAIRKYNYLVQDYIGYSRFYKDRVERSKQLRYFERNLRGLRSYTGGQPRTAIPAPIEHSRGRPWSPGWAGPARNDWAEDIVNASGPIIRMINRRQPRSFHVGAGAFIRQVVHPFG
jgi:hypothetical protein